MRDYAISDDDRATEQEEMARDLAIAAARSFKPEAEAIGQCLNCGEETDPERRWCDKDCMTDWEKRRK